MISTSQLPAMSPGVVTLFLLCSAVLVPAYCAALPNTEEESSDATDASTESNSSSGDGVPYLLIIALLLVLIVIIILALSFICCLLYRYYQSNPVVQVNTATILSITPPNQFGIQIDPSQQPSDAKPSSCPHSTANKHSTSVQNMGTTNKENEKTTSPPHACTDSPICQPQPKRHRNSSSTSDMCHEDNPRIAAGVASMSDPQIPATCELPALCISNPSAGHNPPNPNESEFPPSSFTYPRPSQKLHSTSSSNTLPRPANPTISPDVHVIIQNVTASPNDQAEGQLDASGQPSVHHNSRSTSDLGTEDTPHIASTMGSMSDSTIPGLCLQNPLTNPFSLSSGNTYPPFAETATTMPRTQQKSGYLSVCCNTLPSPSHPTTNNSNPAACIFQNESAISSEQAEEQTKTQRFNARRNSKSTSALPIEEAPHIATDVAINSASMIPATCAQHPRADCNPKVISPCPPSGDVPPFSDTASTMPRDRSNSRGVTLCPSQTVPSAHPMGTDV